MKAGCTVEVGLGFGSNVGDKVQAIRLAVDRLTADGVIRDVRCSSLYRTAPWGTVLDQDWFVNACLVATTSLPPADLLHRCKVLERRLGRTATVRWGPRIIDIDLLFYGTLALETPGLTLPHKSLLERAFVLVPLAEIDPDRLFGGVKVADAARALGDADVVSMGPLS